MAHHIDVTNTLKAVVDTAAGHLDQVINDVIDLTRIYKVRHAELGRQLDFVRVEINTNNAARAHQFGALNDVQANAAQSEHRNGGTGLDFHRKRNGANPGGHTAADVTNLVEGRVFSHFCHGDFGQHGEVREGRTAHVMKNRFAIDGKAAGAIGHEPLALGFTNRLAQVGLGMQAEVTGPAFGGV